MFASFSWNSRRLLLPAAALLILCVLAARGVTSAPAKDLEEKLEATKGKLAHVHETESALNESIEAENREINSLCPRKHSPAF